jgi:hypothetical protein
MPLRAAITTGLAACIVVASARACILPADPAEAVRVRNEWIARDRTIQASLVPKLVDEADTIVIARALHDIEGTLDTNFLILRAIEGRDVGGATPTYQASPSIPPLACTMPSEIFGNTFTVVGETYLLYVRGGRLLRTIDASRSPADISLDEELRLIAEASKRSLERAREESAKSKPPQPRLNR